MFMGLINKIKIQKFYINIKIIINDFFLDTMALFDTGAYSNCILEWLTPTKFFEKTSEKLSTTNGSKLKINYNFEPFAVLNFSEVFSKNFVRINPSKVQFESAPVSSRAIVSKTKSLIMILMFI